ncbi:hypothetical protein GCK72_007424 [Caenorhabditis remanei]|uniref:BTB domain-containing protein n=1 Tax=Caenorhabditis remanei TaxID=31234 RepID=A0A6A5HJ07_CAERE|nr:hypothetical protein GCK72_007424 [Caenorhabditis remanei]KAF1767465.1 hypothetical protein GCK72_007424 [Caenorhabditis remanei]
MASGNIVKLDIGGTVFKTTKSTLTRFDGMLKVMMETEIPVEKDESGCIFIDRSPKHFDGILNFLRDGQVTLPDSEKEILEIEQEAQFYQLDGLMKLCKMYLLDVCIFEIERINFRQLEPTNNFRIIETDKEMFEIITHPKKSVLVIHLPAYHDGTITYPLGFDANILSTKYGSNFDIYYKPYKINNDLPKEAAPKAPPHAHPCKEALKEPFFVIYQAGCIHARPRRHMRGTVTFMQAVENEIALRYKLNDSSLKMSSGNIVKLNIGGTFFQTTKSTLTRFDGMLKVMMETEIPVEKDESGCIFIDRDPTHFRLILNFLRDSHVALPDSEKEILEIEQEAQYYLLSGLMESCKRKLEHSAVKKIPPNHNLRIIETDKELLEIITYPKNAVLVIHLPVTYSGAIIYPHGFDVNALSMKYGSIFDIYYKLYKTHHKVTSDPCFDIYEVNSIHARPHPHSYYLDRTFAFMETLEREIASHIRTNGY